MTLDQIIVTGPGVAGTTVRDVVVAEPLTTVGTSGRVFRTEALLAPST